MTKEHERKYFAFSTNKCDSTQLMEELDDAKIVKYDKERKLILAWFGGHGVHAYDQCGNEVSFWNVGSFRKSADIDEIEQSMEKAIKTGYYP